MGATCEGLADFREMGGVHLLHLHPKPAPCKWQGHSTPPPPTSRRLQAPPFFRNRFVCVVAAPSLSLRGTAHLNLCTSLTPLHPLPCVQVVEQVLQNQGVQASEWGDQEGVVTHCATRVLKTVRPTPPPHPGFGPAF